MTDTAAHSQHFVHETCIRAASSQGPAHRAPELGDLLSFFDVVKRARCHVQGYRKIHNPRN